MLLMMLYQQMDLHGQRPCVQEWRCLRAPWDPKHAWCWCRWRRVSLEQNAWRLDSDQAIPSLLVLILNPHGTIPVGRVAWLDRHRYGRQQRCWQMKLDRRLVAHRQILSSLRARPERWSIHPRRSSLLQFVWKERPLLTTKIPKSVRFSNQIRYSSGLKRWQV